MKIYTKKGDSGSTQLVGGTPIFKSHPRLEAYGTVDELNSQLGLCLLQLEELPTIRQSVLRFQNELFNLGSLLACDNPEWIKNLPPITENMIAKAELEIDEMTASLPELKNFILPGGSTAAAHLHIARTICRRAERATVLLQDVLQIEEQPESEEIKMAIKYLNRLSDWFFVAARFANYKLEIKDQLWQKK